MMWIVLQHLSPAFGNTMQFVASGGMLIADHLRQLLHEQSDLLHIDVVPKLGLSRQCFEHVSNTALPFFRKQVQLDACITEGMSKPVELGSWSRLRS